MSYTVVLTKLYFTKIIDHLDNCRHTPQLQRFSTRNSILAIVSYLILICSLGRAKVENALGDSIKERDSSPGQYT